MIFDYFEPINPQVNIDLERINNLLVDKSNFLSNLSKEKASFDKNAHMHIVPINDLELAIWSIESQRMLYENSDSDYLYFYGQIAKERTNYLYNKNIIHSEKQMFAVRGINGMGHEEFFHGYLLEYMDSIFEKYEINKNLFYRLPKIRHITNEDELNWKYTSDLNAHICLHIEYFVNASYFGGIKKYNLLNRMLECYELGGVPCGLMRNNSIDGIEFDIVLLT